MRFFIDYFVLLLCICLPIQAWCESTHELSAPFMREANLLAGSAQSGGDGLEKSTQPLVGFIYYRAFTPPKERRFVLRMLADALITQLKTSSTPLANLGASEKSRAMLVRFGFSGCWVPDQLWLLCMDDGPRVTWFDQGTKNAQVIGSFPLGISVHSGHLHPVSVHSRIEFGWWKSVKENQAQRSTLNLLWLGAGYSW